VSRASAAIDVSDPVEKFETMSRCAVEAEKTGFDAIWVFDHSPSDRETGQHQHDQDPGVVDGFDVVRQAQQLRNVIGPRTVPSATVRSRPSRARTSLFRDR
jgi:alkanesulfonate monooxygenase SsuD/methylene tetrahydromethanopterin reductase-like flavin-dependent oxidoreductase (luciferase family)